MDTQRLYLGPSHELYHYGIKGQRWGVRRFQNQDGTLTAKGKKRYSEGEASSAPTKSKHRQKLEAKYMARGMSKEDAEYEANRQIKTEKIIAGIAGVTVAAAATYVIAKNVRERSDHIIKSGSQFQRIAENSSINTDHAFYTTANSKDKIKYAGTYAKTIQDNQLHKAQFNSLYKAPGVHKITLNADSDIKVVSRKKAADLFTDLYKNDPDFRENFKKSNQTMLNSGNIGKAHEVFAKANERLTDRQLKKQGYDAFNMGLVNHDKYGSAVADKFYSKLKSMGYDAIDDINDRKYSGYRAKQPVIIFNNKGKISLESSKKMSYPEILASSKKSARMIATPELVSTGLAYVGSFAAMTSAMKAVDVYQIRKYKSQHPNSKLSDKEILKIITDQSTQNSKR